MNMGLPHSIETFGAVDGPGIRTVFFLQGRLRPGAHIVTIRIHGEPTADTETIGEIVTRAKRGIPYYGDNGGVTFSGGEPLMQGNF